MTEADLRWLAGFFDGEGSIPRSKRYPSRLQITVVQKERQILDWIKSHFGGHVGLKRQVPVCHQWITSNRKAVAFLTAILPYLRLKRARAIEALQQRDATLRRRPKQVAQSLHSADADRRPEETIP